MKKNNLVPKTKKPFLYSVFPVALFAAFGAFGAFNPAIPQGAPEITRQGILADTLPGDTTDDPMPADTMGYPDDDADTSAYPTEDFFPADTTGDEYPVDTAGAGEGFDPFPADTNGFNP